MTFPANYRAIRFWFLCALLICCHFLLSRGMRTTTETNIGGIIDENSRIGREQKIAMKIAVQNFNDKSKNIKMFLHLRNSSRDPLQAASAAMELVKQQKVKAICGTRMWQEAVLVAEAGNQNHVPILSLAPAPTTYPAPATRWPYLVQMTRNYNEQIKCIAAIVKYYSWKRIIAVFEDDGYSGNTMILSLLSQALQAAGSEIEYRLALPPLEIMSNSKEIILEELGKTLSTQSRVFIVLHTSLPLTINLFKEAEGMGLMGRDTAWVVTEPVAGLLDTVNSSVIKYMEGALGIKTYYSENTVDFMDFRSQFWTQYRAEYPEEEKAEPGIHAIRAYDTIITITKAVEKLGNTTFSPTELLNAVVSSNFTGLSGEISFNRSELSHSSLFRIINVVGKSYKELDFWSLETGFSRKLGGREDSYNKTQGLHGSVIWPGGVMDDVPKGWEMPTNAKPLRIGVPGRTSFEKFVKVDLKQNPNRTSYSGFSIDVFLEVVKILEESYTLPYEFVAFNGTYDELVDCVHNKTYDAAVGDVTILANRSKLVEFTQPYAKSGLSMIVPFKSKESQKAWLFTKPFTKEMWIAIGAIVVYTTIIVWCLEHRKNPEFHGPWKNQLSSALWFTFSSLFFAHREKIRSNYTRIVVVMWLFAVFVLVSSYTASLTSMLTVPILEPKVKDIEWLIKKNQKVGCDGDSFVREYLTNVLGFKDENILNINSQYLYPDNFNNGTIVAAILELPYERVFLNQYCKSFTHAKQTYRLGGLGFAFQKGSPIAADVSKAILRLSENGVLKALDDKWFSPSAECSDTSSDTERLSIEGFWTLYLFSGTTSTICFLLFLYHLLTGYRKQREAHESNHGIREERIWDKVADFMQYFDKGGARLAQQTRDIDDTTDIDEWTPVPTPPRWDYSTPSESTENYQASPTVELQMSNSINH